jgi:predicted CopG family antitoxin
LFRNKEPALDGARVPVHAPCMAVKTITIDIEAYEVLSRRKRPGQSFSEVIKEHFGRRHTAADLLRAAPTLRLAPQTLSAIDKQIRARKKDLARAPRL